MERVAKLMLQTERGQEKGLAHLTTWSGLIEKAGQKVHSAKRRAVERVSDCKTLGPTTAANARRTKATRRQSNCERSTTRFGHCIRMQVAGAMAAFVPAVAHRGGELLTLARWQRSLTWGL